MGVTGISVTHMEKWSRVHNAFTFFFYMEWNMAGYITIFLCLI